MEICLDPVGGAEHTMGCYKLGIFPFDTTGVVRAARDADSNQGPVEETAPKTRLISRRTADGYRIQAAIPSRRDRAPAHGRKRLGFNLIIYDGDKRDAAPGENINKSRIAWAPRSGVQGRPEDWGRHRPRMTRAAGSKLGIPCWNRTSLCGFAGRRLNCSANGM